MTEDDSASVPDHDVGFISLKELLRMGVNEFGPMETKNVSDNHLYDRLDTLDIEDRLNIIQKLGVDLTESNYHRFVDALVNSLSGGILDVTRWNRLAIKAALIVCSERNLSVSFRNGDRTISPVSYPKEGPLLNMFVESIFTGKWFENS